MRDKVIAVSAVAIAGVAIAVGLTIGAVGGAFTDTTTTVQPPALRSDLSSAARAAPPTGITVPPSPTWEVAVPTTPKPTTTPEPTTTLKPTTTPPATTTAETTTSAAAKDKTTGDRKTPGVSTTESPSTRATRTKAETTPTR
ncbi:hypothetical protein O1W68_03160 [Rhodococcus sp. H36-A4]|uniref:hypothetical protein n=1 Tax=Rhodococcus sp. H36-A4 TaxID=3004353 RepID=UPI0022AEDC91|nr:hypothetical protein [Rhodococcus sp. H36-A4]MCZ4076932.1 hypothetical protein [Rhodococcus sp. H36-A4]